MRDLSLHILDLIENSLRASATVIALTIETSAENDRVTLRIEDNGPGFDVPGEVALDPFFTTKSGKKVGLGLSLFRSTAQRAGGDVRIGRSPLGGALVEATMRWRHVDRAPLGDVAATASAVVATNPQLDLRVRLAADGAAVETSSAAVRGGAANGGAAGAASRMAELIRSGMASVWPGAVWQTSPIRPVLQEGLER